VTHIRVITGFKHLPLLVCHEFLWFFSISPVDLLKDFHMGRCHFLSFAHQHLYLASLVGAQTHNKEYLT